MTTLAERFEILAAFRPEISKSDLARACGVKPPSVTGWFSGGSKNLKAETAIKAANLYGVSLEWLTSGKGEMLPCKFDATPPDQLQDVLFSMSDDDKSGAIDINANRRTPQEPKDVVVALGVLLARVDPNTLASVTALLGDFARNPGNARLASLLSDALTPEAFTQQNQRTG